MRAFCLSAPGVRFVVFEITATDVLLFECFFSSRMSWVVHSRRMRRLAGLAILIVPRLVCEACVYQMRA